MKASHGFMNEVIITAENMKVVKNIILILRSQILGKKKIRKQHTWPDDFYLIILAFFYVLNVHTNFLGGSSQLNAYTFHQKRPMNLK
jgi:hypothetical protein